MRIAVADVNEAPAWPTDQAAECSGSAFTEALASLRSGNSTSTVAFVACLSVKENAAKDAELGSVAAATDPDTLAAQTLS